MPKQEMKYILNKMRVTLSGVEGRAFPRNAVGLSVAISNANNKFFYLCPMQILQKTEIANSILLEYLGELSQAGDKINYFCKKYRTTFNLFEKKKYARQARKFFSLG